MSDSPAPIEYKPLSEIVNPINAKVTLGKDPSKPYIGLENIPSRSSELLGWEKADSSISTNSLFNAGDVLFGKLRPNLRKCVAAPFSGYCSTDILVLRAESGITPEFAARVFQSELVPDRKVHDLKPAAAPPGLLRPRRCCRSWGCCRFSEIAIELPQF